MICFQMTKQKKSIVQTPTKGKGGKGSSSKGGKSENVDIKDIPLDFKTFDIVDSGAAPNYFNIIKRPQNEEIGMEDLDNLQLELESILSSTVINRKHIKDELDILTNLDKYKGKVKKVSFITYVIVFESVDILILFLPFQRTQR